MNTETWVPIHGYEGLYEVSSLGNIRRISVATKILESDLAGIRGMRTQGFTFAEIATKFKVTKRAVIKSLNYRYKRAPLRQPNRTIRPQLSTNGYFAVGLSKNGKVINHRIHQLVAKSFLGKPSPEMEVNHKNGIKIDNRIDNLEFVTASGNALHARRILKIPVTPMPGSLSPHAKLSEANVLTIRELHCSGISGAEIARRFNVHRNTIYLILKRKNWRHI